MTTRTIQYAISAGPGTLVDYGRVLTYMKPPWEFWSDLHDAPCKGGIGVYIESGMHTVIIGPAPDVPDITTKPKRKGK